MTLGDPVSEIKQKLGIVDLVSSHIPLQKAGRGFKALCPFHAEKTPSFYLYPENNSYHCFGCGVSGDIFSFVMKSQNMDFATALRLLAEKTGVTIERPRAKREAEGAIERLRHITEAAAQYYYDLLARSGAGRRAREYLKKRSARPDTWAHWQLGYSLDSWDALGSFLSERGYSMEDAAASGLLVKKPEGGYYDLFRGRLMFPIKDTKGRVIGFGARALDDSQPKYLNSPQTPIFDKSGTLYGIDQAGPAIRQEGQAVVVEGYFDVLIAHQEGLKNVVASLGTALTERQVLALRQLAKRITLALDADIAGEKATERGVETIQQAAAEAQPVFSWYGGKLSLQYQRKLDADIRILLLPQGKDPDELILENRDKWLELVENALFFVDYYFERVAEHFDPAAPHDIPAIADFLLPAINRLSSDLLRSHYLQRLAHWFKVDEREIRRQADSARSPEKRALAAKPSKLRLSPEEYYLALLLNNADLVTSEAIIVSDLLDEPRCREILRIIQARVTAGESLDPSQVQANIDSHLQKYLEQILQTTSREPTLSHRAFWEATRQTELKLRERQCRRLLQETRFQLEEAERGGDHEETAHLRERAYHLHRQLEEIFQLQSSPTG